MNRRGTRLALIILAGLLLCCSAAAAMVRMGFLEIHSLNVTGGGSPGSLGFF
jgi:glycerol-3-phosphate dehydrogenase